MCTLAGPIRLTRYAPGVRQAAHSHTAPHVSLVLAGAFREETGRREITFDAGRVALRPEGLRHAGSFSPNGTLILTSAFPAHAAAITEPRWSPTLSREHLSALTPLLLSDEADAREATWDLIMLTAPEPEARQPSAWISAVRDQLIEEPARADLSSIAEQAGRHRVHLGRTFLAAFGETPSAFRRRAMLDRALCRVAAGAPFAAAAADAGFCDQSHFSRACRDIYGVTPGRLTRHARDVASVQYTAL